MKPIIPPIDKDLIEKELTKERFVRKTNNGDNDIYIITAINAPNTMREIGRLRELTFRYAGGGTGKEIDIDQYDEGDNCFKQLIVWNAKDAEIVGGYRYILCKDAGFDKNGELNIATAELFNFSDKFIREFMPFTIELGRSFVQPKYQPAIDSKKGLFSLDNIWDGLGAIIVDNPDMKYFYGKFTMYTDFDKFARDLILYFLQKYFPDPDKLLYPKKSLNLFHSTVELDKVLDGVNYDEDKKKLIQAVRERKENIPPLVNSYMNLSSTMRTFGTAINEHFGGVEETGILVTIDDIYDTKKRRHLYSYKEQ